MVFAWKLTVYRAECCSMSFALRAVGTSRPTTCSSGVEIARETLDDPLARVPLASYLAVVERARTLTGEPGLGFCMGLQARVSAFGHLGFAAMSAATVREAIEIAVQFAPMISTAMTLAPARRERSGVASSSRSGPTSGACAT